MDTKSLARSKRAHSQHHSKKSHPNPKSRPQQPTAATPSSSDSNTNNPSVGDKPRKPHALSSSSSAALPSNWDRYDDEFDSISSKEASDVVLPKSKGADFGFLISEAHSQLGTHHSSSSSFPSFDDVLPDFDQGICSMLSVRGNGMLSWIGSDNFIVDDDSAINDEVSFLSMDLHSIASKLEKLDASQRLFVEADILPPEMDVDRSNETINPESEQAEGCFSGVANQCLDEIPFLEHCNEKNVFCSSKVMPSTTPSSLTDQLRETTPSTTTTSSTSFQPLSSEENSPVKDDAIQIERSFLGEIMDSIPALSVNDVKDAEEKSTTFEASAAEEELDMLLNSFAEVKLPGSSGMSNKPGNNLRVSEWNATNKLSEGYSSRQLPEQGSKSSTSLLISGGIDDTIDDLLRETFTQKDQKQKVVTPPHVPTTSANSAVSLDDFDSWLDTL